MEPAQPKRRVRGEGLDRFPASLPSASGLVKLTRRAVRSNKVLPLSSCVFFRLLHFWN